MLCLDFFNPTVLCLYIMVSAFVLFMFFCVYKYVSQCLYELLVCFLPLFLLVCSILVFSCFILLFLDAYLYSNERDRKGVDLYG